MTQRETANKILDQKAFHDTIDALSPSRDLLIVKMLVTNMPIINAQFGDENGDEVLEEIAANLGDLRHAQLVTRISPVLFGVIAEDESNPSHFLKSIQDIILNLNSSGRFRFLVETSTGAIVTDYRANISSANWLARLNLAILKSTRTGIPEMADEIVAESEGIRQELARLSPGSAVPDGMHWVFQPINDTKTREVFGYETLCRWNIPGMGNVSPEVFIQIAEDMNLVQMIDLWTLAAVERAYPELVKLGGQMITVNVSSQTLVCDKEFFHAVDRVLPRIRDAHFSLVFELTETSIIKNQIELNASLASLRKRGAKIAIDDFGTGQTSLSIISSLPTDFVKLDGSLLEVERPDLSKGLLELGMKFATLVGAKVIVEKVETEADLELARAVGADYVQGWLFGKPISLGERPVRTTKTSRAPAKKAKTKAPTTKAKP